MDVFQYCFIDFLQEDSSGKYGQAWSEGYVNRYVATKQEIREVPNLRLVRYFVGPEIVERWMSLLIEK